MKEPEKAIRVTVLRMSGMKLYIRDICCRLSARIPGTGLNRQPEVSAKRRQAFQQNRDALGEPL